MSEVEQELLKKQGILTGIAVPLQRRVVDLARARRYREAQKLLVEKAIPAQDRVFAVLQQLHEFQEQRNEQILRTAHLEYRVARLWVIGLSGSTLLLGLLIAYIVVREYRNSDRALR